MRRIPWLLCLALYLPLLPALGQTPPPPIPGIVAAGLQAYRNNGPEAAIAAWLKGSPIEGSKEALAQANQLREIQDFYGNYRSSDLIAAHAISPTTHIVYIVMNFDKGPLFGKFLTYRTGQGWIVASFSFNTAPDQVLPASMQ
jgi:hypothetical protein